MKLIPLAHLPATNENVVHLHRGSPTPHREGIAARCEVDDKHLWYANAQPGYGYADEVTYWPRANAHIWIVKGAVYLVRIDQAYSWQYYDDLGIECRIAPDENNAFIATYTDVVCLDVVGFVVWRKSVAVDGVEITAVGADSIDCRVCYDPPQGWEVCRLDRQTGNLI
jgi:hypothetical protein